MELEWHRRRIELNHDWLSNQFIFRLRDSQSLLASDTPDTEAVARFLTVDVTAWADKAAAFSALIESFETEMSPRILLAWRPFSSVAGYALGDLVHRLWLSRNPVSKWLEEARSALGSVQCHIASLTDCLSRVMYDVLRMKPRLIREFEELDLACCRLYKAVKVLPSEILVV
jgi:hypothetical protein